ncbi:voltage-dependent calcium channel subunit alpha-2/delta-3-like isoform X1 [Macrosteles quadrilineatus]|uniref:voltage-dependent calcium channel subunit alpha-2/delta-3-like isoform X1 n=1 Tax=Macrosteles quadrilineatus TaxID=74068 RepID=UPI0023E2BBC9|nr:voltage-dependent calcium channel subunit alpha-2/delta-3-like isoform X1 [Macrosteles quadrilineatus]
MSTSLVLLFVLLVGRLPVSYQQDEDIPHNEVKNWALKFGVDLWEFGRQFTKMNEIQRKYHDKEAEVARKDGLILIRELAAEVKNMMDIKMNAVMRIMDSAEQAALSQKMEGGTPKYLNSRRMGDDIMLIPNRHFDQQPVNTSFSSVLMPQALSDSDPLVANSLRWSEHLDPVFVNNYEVDPTLSWQFYGSTSGFLRRFPAMKWPTNEVTPVQDLHNFRLSNWFVGAADSPKDVVILLDTSSSMTGLNKQLAKAVVSTILDTLTDNDFVNVFTFSEMTQELLPCYKDMLAQATDANRRELKSGLDNVKSENIANFTGAFVTAFEILHKYNRTSQGCQCNQAIMLVTDGPSNGFQDVFKQYNWPHMPVRVFTYLVGSDASNAKEMHWIACNNKGYYEHVKAPGEVIEKVLNYVKVLARPMIMYQSDHPVYWTPVYAGGKSNTLLTSLIKEGELMTTVSTPIFDRRNHSERAANLLGVVGTDIPIRQLAKLVPPYKLGINGYSFIVNNNGHVLYHPDLRPLFVETLKPNYNNVDLSNVELVDSETVGYENNTQLMFLRNDMIDQKEGESELKVKVHYDDMRRVTIRRQKYFYHPIDDTPFSLGLALPDGYGMYEVLAEEEIKLSQINVTEYFKGNNWRVHPDWVYCEYNYPNEHYFTTPEEQVIHFLSRTRRPGWKWMSLRPRSPHRNNDGHAGAKRMERDSYYCDKTLMQSLVFDAMITHDIQRAPTSTLKEDKHPIATLMALLHRQGYTMFGVTLSFIATRSGLLRWEEHMTNGQSDPLFSENNRHAMDETWYKRAVDQHTIEPESFVFSVPFDSGNTPGTQVMATHAVFVEHKGHRAPAAVVGLQFQHSVLASHFINITSACTGKTGCKKTCASEELDCYVLDNNGFIILSEKSEHTGMFFGQADGTIMDSLVQDGIYKKIPVMDYQGACVDSKSNVNAGFKLLLPWQTMGWLVHWFFSQLVWFAAQTVYTDIHWTYAQEDVENPIYSDDYETSFDQYGGSSNGGSAGDTMKFPGEEDVPPRVMPPPPPAVPPRRPTPHNRTRARPCTKRVDLYMLQPGRLNNSGSFNPLKGKLTNCHVTGCERPFSVQKIPHSNLILLVVDTMCPCGSKQLSIAAQELPPPEQCRVPVSHSLYRRRPSKCISYHPEEIEIKQCGGCNRLVGLLTLIVTSGLLLLHTS